VRGEDRPRRFEMGERVLNLFMASRKKSWYELSEEEHESLSGKMNQAFEEVGGKRPVFADCSWSTPDYEMFGVEEFPSIEALRQYMAALREMGFSQHMEETYVIGTPWESQPDDS